MLFESLMAEPIIHSKNYWLERVSLLVGQILSKRQKEPLNDSKRLTTLESSFGKNRQINLIDFGGNTDGQERCLQRTPDKRVKSGG